METEIFTYLRASLALLFVVGLILLCAAIIRKTGWDRKLTGAKPGKRRLAVVESLYLDPKHRLVIVQRDRKEHLLLLGTTGNMLIESDFNEERVS